ncbi:MAG: hypothetical protein RLZZ437_3019 [Pseudomonadota bacterium]|jgi:hypothetical protein
MFPGKGLQGGHPGTEQATPNDQKVTNLLIAPHRSDCAETPTNDCYAERQFNLRW